MVLLTDIIFESTPWVVSDSALPKIKEIIEDYNQLTVNSLRNQSDFLDKTNEFEKKYSEFITSGTTRIVIPVGQFVVKFTRFLSAQANKNEVNAMICFPLSPLLVEYDKKNYHWLICERLIHDENLIKEKARSLFPYLANKEQENGVFNTYSQDSLLAIHPTQKYDYSSKRLFKAASSDGIIWLQKFVEGVKKCKIRTSDLQWFNWGISSLTGELIPLDFG